MSIYNLENGNNNVTIDETLDIPNGFQLNSTDAQTNAIFDRPVVDICQQYELTGVELRSNDDGSVRGSCNITFKRFWDVVTVIITDLSLNLPFDAGIIDIFYTTTDTIPEGFRVNNTIQCATVSWQDENTNVYYTAAEITDTNQIRFNFTYAGAIETYASYYFYGNLTRCSFQYVTEDN